MVSSYGKNLTVLYYCLCGEFICNVAGSFDDNNIDSVLRNGYMNNFESIFVY